MIDDFEVARTRKWGENGFVEKWLYSLPSLVEDCVKSNVGNLYLFIIVFRQSKKWLFVFLIIPPALQGIYANLINLFIVNFYGVFHIIIGLGTFQLFLAVSLTVSSNR